MTADEIRNQIQSLQAQLKELQKQEDEERERTRQLAREELRNLPLEWSIKPETYKEWNDSSKHVGARISKRPNQEELKLLKEKYGSEHFTQDDERWNGMFYYRTDEGILTQCGGGYHILRTPRLCSDEEWDLILKGQIPEKFLHKHLILDED